MMTTIKLSLIVLGMVLLVGCDGTAEERTIDYIAIDQTTVSESYDIGFISIEDIDIVVYYKDKTYEKIKLNENLISSSDLEKFEVEGEHTIEVLYGGWLTDFMDPSGMFGIFTQGNAYNDPVLVKSYVSGWSRSVLGSINFSTATIVEAE